MATGATVAICEQNAKAITAPAAPGCHAGTKGAHRACPCSVAERENFLVTESHGTPARAFTGFRSRARGGGRDLHAVLTRSAVTRGVAAATSALGVPVRPRSARAVAERRFARTRRAQRNRRG